MAKKTTKKVENIVETEIKVDNTVTLEEVQQEIKETIEDAANEMITEVKEESEKTESEFNEVVSAVTEKIAEEVRKKDDFLKTFESEIPVKSEEELKETLIKEIERVSEVINNVTNKNNTPLTTYYWNGMRYDI